MKGLGSVHIFLEESVDVSRPLEAVRGRFLGDGSWFVPFATIAEEGGEALYLRVGPSWANLQAARQVRVTLGPPHSRGDAMVVPLSWQASALPGLFPVLEGDLEVAPLDPERCRVTLTASYVPPLGEVGRQLDHVLLHRVAHSTVRAFLDRVADQLEENDPVRDLRPGWI
jgi:hypothetical protein